MTNFDTINVVIIEESPNAVETMLAVLRKEAVVVRHVQATSLEIIESELNGGVWDVILFATSADDCSIEEIGALLERLGLDLPVIAVYSEKEPEPALRIVELMEKGACDAVCRTSPRHLGFVVQRELRNVLERRNWQRSEEALHEKESRWQALLDSSRDPIAYVHGGMHVCANDTYLDMFGFRGVEELEGFPLMDLIASADRDSLKDLMRDRNDPTLVHNNRIDVKGMRLDGSALELSLEMLPASFEGEECWQIIIRGQTDSEEIQAELDYMKRHDSVTGLRNRRSFVDELGDIIGRGNAQQPSVVMYIELDNFAGYVERLGPETGEGIMTEVGAALKEATSEDELLARYADGAFGYATKALNGAAIEQFAEWLRVTVEERSIENNDRSLSVTCSIGLTKLDSGPIPASHAIRVAQAACQSARAAGGNRVKSLRPDDVQMNVAQSYSDEDIAVLVESALDGGRASLAFQPIVNFQQDAGEIFEVLLRIDDETGQNIPPSVVFKTIKNNELLAKLDRWVIEQTVERVHENRQQGRMTRFFINLSSYAVVDESLLLFINKKLREYSIPGQHLVIEIEEELAVTQGKNIRSFIKGLKELNCYCAIEHFGSGLCTMSHLEQLPVDFVKIEPTLIQTVVSDKNAEASIYSIIEGVHNLERRVIAFGVEDTETLAALWTLGVDFVQGNVIARPDENLEWDFETSELV